MTDRDKAILKAMSRYLCASPTVLARLLNLATPCAWCPVVPNGTRPAIVPEASRKIAWRALESLAHRGMITKDMTSRRFPIYELKTPKGALK